MRQLRDESPRVNCGMQIPRTALAAGCALFLPLILFAAEPAKPMNSIFLIAPYKYHGAWVFDDPSTGLNKEPFVAGIDTMIDKLVADIPNAEKGFRAFFSAAPFPGHMVKLELRRPESGGNWYYSPQFQMEGWLCPALFKYFPEAPKEIYVKVEPLPGS
jgi:hypothetical protein